MLDKNAVENKYFNWLVDIVKVGNKVSYRKLLAHLHSTDFVYKYADSSRASDGEDLRYRFYNEIPGVTKADLLYLNSPCSMLEMMIALAIRCEETIMDDPRYGNRTKQWFWNMMKSLGLNYMNDDCFDRDKIEWAIGSIIEGDSKYIQKFMVLYGSAGTGKSTILNIIQRLFEGYYSVFDAKALGSSSNSFALEAFKSNPMVAIQHDGDLSRIEDNTRLNSLVSHELMTVNEKFKSTYANKFNAFLFMGTNKPVKITDSKSGLLRRLIDVMPSGKKLDQKDYNDCINKIPFELASGNRNTKEQKSSP